MILSLPCPLPPKGLLLPILDAEYALPPDDRGTPCETGSKRGQDDVIPFFETCPALILRLKFQLSASVSSTVTEASTDPDRGNFSKREMTLGEGEWILKSRRWTSELFASCRGPSGSCTGSGIGP